MKMLLWRLINNTIKKLETSLAKCGEREFSDYARTRTIVCQIIDAEMTICLIYILAENSGAFKGMKSLKQFVSLIFFVTVYSFFTR